MTAAPLLYQIQCDSQSTVTTQFAFTIYYHRLSRERTMIAARGDLQELEAAFGEELRHRCSAGHKRIAALMCRRFWTAHSLVVAPTLKQFLERFHLITPTHSSNPPPQTMITATSSTQKSHFGLT
jgi:hypothetical protein